MILIRKKADVISCNITQILSRTLMTKCGQCPLAKELHKKLHSRLTINDASELELETHTLLEFETSHST